MLKTFTTAAVLAATAVAGLAAPAYAADGAFDFNGFFSHRLDSRSYTTGRTGTHTVTKTTADCPGPGDNMRVRLVRNVTWGGDYNYPWKTWNCTDDDQFTQLDLRVGHHLPLLRGEAGHGQHG